MKKLFILRHAQAASSSTQGDKGRKLTDKGTQDSLALGRLMKIKVYRPDFIFCSPAIRTQETLDGLLNSLPEVSAQYPEKLYNGSADDLLHFIQNAPEGSKNLMVIAHNPGIHQLAGLLAQENASPLTNKIMMGFQPGTLGVFECPCEKWNEIQPGKNTLTDFLDPLDYNALASPARWT